MFCLFFSGATTLEHYLNASLLLIPEAKNVFIMTDDDAVLRMEMSLLGKNFDKLNIYSLPASPTHRAWSLDSSAEFWASVAIAQQCAGFVAFATASAASVAILHAMCNQHTSMNGVRQFNKCPSVFDITNLNSGDMIPSSKKIV